MKQSQLSTIKSTLGLLLLGAMFFSVQACEKDTELFQGPQSHDKEQQHTGKDENAPEPPQQPNDDSGATEEPENKPQLPTTPKPSDYYMSSRAQVKWKKDVEQNQIDIDRIVRQGDTSFFTAKYLSRWVDFCSSTPNSSDFYLFSEEDMAHVQLRDIEYRKLSSDQLIISFNIEYKGYYVERNQREKAFITLSLDTYYANKVAVRSEMVKHLYAYGAMKYSREYIEDFFSYDHDLYIVEQKDQTDVYMSNDDKMDIQLSIKDRQTEKVLAVFLKEITGFKSMKLLNDELTITPSERLWSNLSRDKRLRLAPNGDVASLLKDRVRNWAIGHEAEKVEKSELLFYYKSQDDSSAQFDMFLLREQGTYNWVLTPSSRRVKHLHLCFYDPHFTLLSATKQNERVILKVSLSHINDSSFDGKTLVFEGNIAPNKQ